ncbi:unnamed protein product [Symbiodinium natans]|uniref:Uncharacterized protein n=1 Tax=Symbiodinium natans TaxID=878477 RepID=A0A812LYL7_9DINO|nr:unnamed protein product [Symbiodinium natans]
MDLQALAGVARQQQQAAAPRAGGLRARRRALRRVEARERRASSAQASFRLQAQQTNRSGRGRTEDHILPVSSGAKRSAVKGKGAWKRWTPDAILRGGFSPGSMSSRSAAGQMEGASASGVMSARLLVAECIEQGQKDYASKLQRQLHHDGDGPLDFAVLNMMFDETELELDMGSEGEAAWSVLASHSQITFCSQGQVVDFDAVRAPCVLPTKKAATMWPVLGAGVGGLWPGVTSVDAEMRAVLITCDAGPANIKLLKHLCACLPDSVGLIPTLCAQHRNGNVIERATKLLGILPGCFAVSKTMIQGSWMRTIGKRVQEVLAARLIVMEEDPEGLQEEWARSRVAARALLDLVILNAPQGEDDQPARGFATAVSDFMTFFPGPWKGPPVCSCAGDVLAG